MNTITRTFSIILNSLYTVGSILELIHFRDIVLEPDDCVAIYLDSFYIKVFIPSFVIGKFPILEGYESDAEKLAAYTVAEAASQKLGLQLSDRKNDTGEWSELSKAVIINRGREDYFDLMSPYLGSSQSRSMERNDALAVSLIDYGNGLLWDTDTIRITATATIVLSKKNDLDSLIARLETLELAISGKLTGLPADTLLGRDTTTGIVESIPQSRFVVSPLVDSDIPISIQRIAESHQLSYDPTTNYLVNFFAETDYLSIGGNGIFPVSTYGSAWVYLLSEIGHPGIAGISSGNNGTVPSGGSAGTGSGSTGGILFANGITTYIAIIRIPTLRTSTEDFLIEVGFQTAGTSIGLDACCFVYDSASLSWQCHTRKAGALSIFAGNVLIIAGSWYTLKITVSPSGLAQFFINESMVVETVATIPTVPVNSGIDFRKTIGVNGRDIHIDHQSVRQTFTSPRT
jgi:hypothetical protein